MEYKNIVLIIAIVVVLSLMTLIATIMSKATTDVNVNNCPDYWSTLNKENTDADCLTSTYGCCNDSATSKDDAAGTNCPIKCYNVHSLGKISSTCTSIPTEVDFKTDTYTGNNGLCNKQTWAKQCGITWDGVTNASSAC